MCEIVNLIILKFTLNNLDRLESGVLMIAFGIVFSIIFKNFHKGYKNEGYKLFRPFRREGKTQSEDGLFLFLFWRSFIGIFMGIFIAIGGIVSIICYFINK